MFKLMIPIGVSLALIAGCKNTSAQDNNIDAAHVNTVLQRNVTTLSEAKLLLGSPAFISVTEDGKKIAGFNLVNKAFTEDFSNNLIKGTMSFGKKATLIPKITKNVFLELDENNVVTDYKFAGTAWVEKQNFFVKNEAKITLSQQEIFEKQDFTAEYIYGRYQQILLQNIQDNYNMLSETDSADCEYKCQLYKNANDLYGTLYKVQTDNSKNIPGQI
ncbi:MAG: hypothetical protein J6Z28_07560 [Succinivibrio sp.]|nr:hypothetical protein [Succinivibrio sp.]